MGILKAASSTTKVVSWVSSRSKKKIKTELDQLTKDINKLNKAIDEYIEAERGIVDLIKSVDSVWKGDSADAYKNLLRRYGKAMSSNVRILFKILNSAQKRHYKLEEKYIWAKSINDSSNMVGKALKGAKLVSKIL